MLPLHSFAVRTCMALTLCVMGSATHAQTTSRMTYTVLGQIASVDGPRTDVADITRYGYDDYGNLVTVTNALGHVTQLRDHDEFGNPRIITDANGVATRLHFDSRGQLISSETAGAKTVLTYDKQGNIVRVTQPNGDWTNYGYDPAQRLVLTSNQSGEAIYYERDTAGNIVSEQIRDAQSQVVKQRRQAYDELGRLLKILGASGQVRQLRHDAADNLVASKNGRGYDTANRFDALNRLTKSENPQGGVTEYTYDAENRPLSVSDPRNITTHYEYDERGNVIKLVSPDTGTSLFSYDEASNLIKSTDARGEVVEYRYDALNRLITRTYPSSPALDTRFTYDETADGNKGIGRLTSITDASGTLRYSYDLMGKRVAESRTLKLLGKQVPERLGMKYDANGNLTGLEYPHALNVDYVRGNAAQVEEIRVVLDDTTYQVARDIHYLPFGPLQSLTWGNGLRLERIHDKDYRLNSQTLGNWKSEYTYDKAGNIVRLKQGPREVAHYTYDPLDRLSKERTPAHRKTYILDEVGNRTQRTTTALNGDGTSDQQVMGYAKDNNRLINLNGQDVAYDASGNQLISGGRRFVYDAQGRLSEAYQASVQKVADYQYNALGQRVSMHRFDPSTSAVEGLFTYLYDPLGQLLGQTRHAADGTRVSARYWIWLDRMPVAQVDLVFDGADRIVGSTLTYLHTDHLNTPRLASDKSQKLVWRWDSDAYGVGGLDEDVDLDGAAVQVDLRLPGQLYDAESGLNYNYFRDYNPETGRYIQSDPIGLRGGPNTYGYATGNPLKLKDLLGLSTTIIIIRDYGMGSHAAVHNDYGDSGSAMLYDPAGSYLSNQRGTGDMFYDNEADLNAYVQYHRNLGSTVNTYTFATTPNEERQIHNNASDQGGAAPGWCSVATSSAISGIGPFSSLEIYGFPGSLETALKGIQGGN